MTDFRKELESLINRHSLENSSNTPDWILAEFICESLDALNHTIQRRDRYYGYRQDETRPEDGTPPSSPPE